MIMMVVMCREKATDIQIYTSLLCQYIWTCGSTAMEINRATGATLAVQNWFSITCDTSDCCWLRHFMKNLVNGLSPAEKEREKLGENSPTMKSPLNLFRLVDASGERLKKSCKLLKTSQAVFHLSHVRKAAAAAHRTATTWKRDQRKIEIFSIFQVFYSCGLLLLGLNVVDFFNVSCWKKLLNHKLKAFSEFF